MRQLNAYERLRGVGDGRDCREGGCWASGPDVGGKYRDQPGGDTNSRVERRRSVKQLSTFDLYHHAYDLWEKNETIRNTAAAIGMTENEYCAKYVRMLRRVWVTKNTTNRTTVPKETL